MSSQVLLPQKMKASHLTTQRLLLVNFVILTEPPLNNLSIYNQLLKDEP